MPRFLALRVAATVIIGSLALTLTSAAHAQPPCARALPAMRTALQSACWRPFGNGSPFNQALPADPTLAPNNSAVHEHIGRYGWWLGESNTGFSLELGGSRPVYFAGPFDPTMTIHCTDQEGPGTCQGANGVDVNGLRINVPRGARPDADWDAHMTIVETATGAEYDFWHASVSGSTLTAGTGGETNVTTADGTGGAGDAAGFALTAGLLRPSELLSGNIDHALVIEVPCTNATGRNVGYTYPADGGWGERCGAYWREDPTTAPALGQRFYLRMTDGQIASSGAPDWEQTIMTALARYGAYIEDTNGTWHTGGMFINTQDPTSWTSLGQSNPWAVVARRFGAPGAGTLTSRIPIPVAKLGLVNTCVTQGTCPSSPAPPGLAGHPTGARLYTRTRLAWPRVARRVQAARERRAAARLRALHRAAARQAARHSSNGGA